MKKSKASNLKTIIEKACKEKGVPYSKKFYRRAKNQFKKMPWKEREDFGVADLR